MSELKDLQEYNAEKMEWHTNMGDTSPRKNGIACPECGGELYDSAPNVTLTSNPPQKHIHCDNCDYNGTRIA